MIPAARPALTRASWLCIAPLVLLAALLFGTAVGETQIPFSTVIDVLSTQLGLSDRHISTVDEAVIWHYRMARAVVAACCGAGLALSGLVLQALLRNALADPYLLGISAGASTGVVMVTVAGIGAGVISMSVGAFTGALTAFAFVAMLAYMSGGTGVRSAGVLILAGIAGAQLFNALTAFIIAQSASAEQARGIMFWLLGSLSGVRWPDAWLAMPIAGLAVGMACWHVRTLDAFTFGTESAAVLGINLRWTKILLISTTALVTAIMVSITGAIGFVGLVVPHACRLIVGVRHRQLVPATALMGAVFLIVSDVVSRIIIPGQVVPIGVITALVGAPAFALIMVRGRRR
ncbi:FecCD family ABC transporter permease [Vreelandella olivaria]|uniref:FecCD family ABC transporter permease n=1 Tax=Vreelandella olivaria TaxID=390919 RepID=UPI00201EE2B5|nr:iron ABC transporter permease [Halomonas olivaria]